MKIQWSAYKDCTAVDENDCNHPFVKYENEDGCCYHRVCEGKHLDCGKIIDLVEV